MRDQIFDFFGVVVNTITLQIFEHHVQRLVVQLLLRDVQRGVSVEVRDDWHEVVHIFKVSHVRLAGFKDFEDVIRLVILAELVQTGTSTRQNVVEHGLNLIFVDFRHVDESISYLLNEAPM